MFLRVVNLVRQWFICTENAYLHYRELEQPPASSKAIRLNTATSIIPWKQGPARGSQTVRPHTIEVRA